MAAGSLENTIAASRCIRTSWHALHLNIHISEENIYLTIINLFASDIYLDYIMFPELPKLTYRL